MWYQMFWDRKDKFNNENIYDKKAYVIDYKDNKIYEGKIGKSCLTTGVIHVWCEDKKEEWKDVIATWNDIEPLTGEGYNVLVERLKSIT